MPRPGEPLRIGRETVSFGRNIVQQRGTNFTLQHRLFVNDPWELMAEAIARAVADEKIRDIAQSFRRQAEDYFRATTIGSELAVRPVLLYYAFLNLSKAFAITKGNVSLAARAYHGISFPKPKPRAIPGSIINFDNRKIPAVFQELLKHLDGNQAMLHSPLRLGEVLPQILPGHRLWCYAGDRRRPERFVTVEHFRIMHFPNAKQVWLNLFLNRSDLDRLGLSETTVLGNAGLGGDFEPFPPSVALWDPDLIGFQQKQPESYAVDPAEALSKVIRRCKNVIWETVKVASPYRKQYIYCCPQAEHKARLPQMLSVYLLMYVLGAVTRYFPGYFEELLESKYGPFFNTFISESPMQFLYLMASDMLGQEVSKPAII